MNRKEKQAFISTFSESIQQSTSVVVANYSGLSVADMQALRGRMREAGGSVKVAKNRLAKIAVRDTAHASLVDKLTGQLVFLYAQDPMVSPKIAVDYAKENDKFELVVGSLDGHTLDIDGIKKIASLPSLDELRAKIIGVINAPATKLTGVVQAPVSQLARVFAAYGKHVA